MLRLAAALAGALGPALIPDPALAQATTEAALVVDGVRVVVRIETSGGAAPGTAQPARAAETAVRLMQDWSQPGHVALGRMAGHYGAQVDFCGRRLSHAQVMADRQAFVLRWPVRDYRIDPTSLWVTCDQFCHVSGEYDFDAYDPASGTRSLGRASLHLTLRPAGSGMVVVAEGGTVLWRY